MATTEGLSTVFTTPSDRELVAVRVFEAPKSRLWETQTQPKHLQQWMLGPQSGPMTMPECDIDLRPGGKWHHVWKESNGSTMEMYGEIKEVVPGEKLVQTENWGSDYKECLDTMVLTEDDGKTTLTTTVLYDSEKDRQAAIETGMLKGWSESYDRLDDYLRRMS
jgi:uncharacterized protein YndB with AHSA1/START domain